MIGVKVTGFDPGSTVRLAEVDQTGHTLVDAVAETVADKDTTVTFRGGVTDGHRYAVRGTALGGGDLQVYAMPGDVPAPPTKRKPAAKKPSAALKKAAKAKPNARPAKAASKPARAAKKGK